MENVKKKKWKLRKTSKITCQNQQQKTQSNVGELFSVSTLID